MRITSKGQVTIPVSLREKAGLMPNTEVDFVLEGTSVRIAPRAARVGAKRKKTRGERLVDRLRGSGSGGMSTDEIMKLMRGDEWPDLR